MDKKQVVQQFGKNAKDFGATGVQVGFLTLRIKELTEHLRKNPKDLSTQRGLKQKVEDRKKLIKYLKRSNLELFHKVVEAFSIRH
ncbi:MAG: 30S ribosomal protein S15 [Gammaproteobacteria bacterium]|jgi:small subunit ribosomal protein S15|nr:30S ribosomal protein S15 [Gammaproteobacteria bacterium]